MDSLLKMKMLGMNERTNVDWWSASCRRLPGQWSPYAIKTCKLKHVSTPFHIPRFPESKSV
jgi:hypothetical protein